MVRITVDSIKCNTADAVTLGINDLALGVYRYLLVVTDTSGLSATDDIIVTVQDTVPRNWRH
jgi:hypothetical protein